MSVETISSLGDLDCTTVDADFHLTEQIADYAPYLEEPWDRMFKGNDPFDEHAEFYDPFPDPGMVPLHIMSGRSQIFDPNAVRTVEDIHEGLDLLGIDRALVTPGATILKLGVVHNDDLAAAIARAFNEFMLAEISDEDAEVPVPITIAGQKPAEAAEEIDDRRNESNISCVFMPTSGLNPPIGHEWFDPIYEATEDAGLPFVTHNGAGGDTLKSFPVQYDWFSTEFEDHVIAHPFQHIVNIVSMVAQGVPERFDIDFLFQEAGIGYVPYFAYRMDNEYFQKRQDAPLLTKPPSEYILGDFYYTTQPLEGHANNPNYVRKMARLMGAPDNLMFSSDYPHQDFDHADTIFRLFPAEFNKEELENIFGRNATDVFF